MIVKTIQTNKGLEGNQMTEEEVKLNYITPANEKHAGIET